jgi:hypothetical protein
MKTQHQYSLSLIQHEANGSVIAQRSSDGYVNATALCKAAGKLFADYTRTDSTKAFLAALSAKMGIPIDKGNQCLIESRAGSPATGGGSWVHPQVAINLGQWLSPDFAVQVSEWVVEWMSGKGAPQGPARLPPHLERYLKNDAQVPQGYFSILQETALNLFGPLHNLGFEIPKGWVPDISVGKLYCAWLRDQHGVNTDALPTYAHDYLDGRPIVYPKVYPESLLPDYKNWFRTVWLPENGVQYFRKKDPSCMAYLDRLPALAAPKAPPPIIHRWGKGKQAA